VTIVMTAATPIRMRLEDRSVAFGQLVFEGQERALSVQDIAEIDLPGVVLVSRQNGRLASCSGRPRESLVTVLLFDVGHQPVFNILEAGEYCRFIRDERLFLQRRLHFDLVPDGPPVENRNSDTRTDTERPAARQEEVAESESVQADGAVQGQFGIELGLGHAHACRLGRELIFRFSYIGSSPQEIRRSSHGELHRAHGDGPPLLQQFMNRPWGLPQEDRQPVLGFLEARAKRWDLRTGALEVILCLLNGKLRGEPGLAAPFRQTVGFPLRLEILLGHRAPCLEGAGIHIVQAHFGHEGDQHIAKVLLVGLQVGRRGLHRTSHPIENVHFPSRIESHRIEVRFHSTAGIFAGTALLDGSHGIDGRGQTRQGDFAAGTRLTHP
jgi:hypothetical protein